ncbi:CRISPR-associated Cas3 family helicase [Mesocricetibacter intestinalis]|uniref:CRISPR-associated Cas3 family helicase n=1 Tax=Mesocricetibacter intestinalis TaxID=1521930 RepID=A0A4R6V7S7_9PAST|nr:CRISPR-associated helicase Cas3' [Mesocricetibacter intestinalis]TDQ57406.1 CRISPR-associated Cas3 family helicase [Mesocricetibacter intestinalis]
MKTKTFIAHIRKTDKAEQSVAIHLTETAAIARELATKLDLPEAGELLGLMHDFGKYSKKFQKRIHKNNGLEFYDFDEDAGTDDHDTNKPDHSTAGAQWIYRRLKKFGAQNGIGELVGQILGLCIASHHGVGLIDCLNSEGEAVWLKRFQRDDVLTHLAECEQNADETIKRQADGLADKALIDQVMNVLKPIVRPMVDSFQKERPAGKIKTSHKIEEFYLGCLTRFLFSCLIDADRINSADFEREAQKDLRRLTQKPNWQEVIEKLEIHLADFEIRYPIDQIRRDISDACLQRAADPQGIYTLSVPTGGGKTLASLRYALHHAQKHNLDRIIYIIPYTSIIDQNAESVRKIYCLNPKDNGDSCRVCSECQKWVLEHHSNLEPEKQNWQDKLLSENWDKPIVFTTMVQFLDAWFGGGTRGARHIHPMTKSVLIFDEIQTLPVKCVHLFCNTLNWLAKFGKSSAILCTATQPLLNKLPKSEFGELKLAENAEIMGDEQEKRKLFDDLSRVEILYQPKAGGWSVEEAGGFLLEQYQAFSSCLFIVNTKEWAKDLYQYCQKQNVSSEALFHLSTNQCSAHRKIIFDEIKGRLKNKQPVICISTQLIEAGVDISMACVIRALGGLDSIAQAAGRCNRHGEKEGKGQVYVLNLQETNLARILPDIYQGQVHAERILREFAGQDILQPTAMQRYFQYYFYNRSGEMSYAVKDSASGSLLDWLSDNSSNVYAAKNNRRSKPFPLLMQSFKSAGQAFQAIDAPTRALIVPYGEGRELIASLCGEWEPKKMYCKLAKAQRYSVNVFPNVWKQLEAQQALQEVQAGSGIYYLKDGHYTDEYGLSVDKVGIMPTYNF